MNGTTNTIEGNHGHVITVTKADIQAGVDKDYHIMGASPHDHLVTITAAQFAMLAMNKTITDASSTTNQHSHVVTIICA